MKKQICEQCGGNEFIEIENGVECAFCHTQYIDSALEEANKIKQIKIDEKTSETAQEEKVYKFKTKFWTINIILFSIALLVFFVIAIVGALKNPNNSEINAFSKSSSSSYGPYGSPTASSRDKYEFAANHLSEIPGWTNHLFYSIHCATETKDGADGKMTYTGGTLYSTLAAALPAPTQIYSTVDDEGQNVLNAVWRTPATSKNNVEIDIQYNQKSGQIVNWNFAGYKN
ncbi:hypothetical protein [Lactococcus allomyrinae]|uniref:Uncharacterized protein n=1 Tax=Lactococcus allomyrinae TaxID=2419773 RepID=A0A387BB57_9LACT|nr:hypothetical protein [Lactococcus allomyrinae]AYG00993.1 hypothetical protein D7I46_07770 [Lactococcus allomyrinae]